MKNLARRVDFDPKLLIGGIFTRDFYIVCNQDLYNELMQTRDKNKRKELQSLNKNTFLKHIEKLQYPSANKYCDTVRKIARFESDDIILRNLYC